MEKKLITKAAVLQLLGDYWRQYKKYPFRSAVGFFVPAIGNIFVFYVPPLVVAQIINSFTQTGSITFANAYGYIVLFGGLWIAGEMLWRIGSHFLIDVEARGLNDLSKTAFRRLSGRDYDFYSNNFVGTLTKKTIAFSRSFETFTDTLIFNVFGNVFPIIFAAIILWRYSPWIPLLLIVSMGVVIAVALPIIRGRSKLVALRHEASSKMSGRLSDSITNMLAVKSFAKEGLEADMYDAYAEDLGSTFKKASDYQNLRLEAAISPLYVGTNVVGLIAAIFFAQKLGLAASAIFIVFSYYSQVTRTFWDINRVYRSIESAVSEAAEFTQLLIDRPTIEDAPQATELEVSSGTIRFEQVRFGYGAGDTTPFLDNFDLDIKPNQKVGLVGPSGGGKTTITKLILRFVDVSSGSISIDGQNVSSVTQASLRRAVAYVPQEPLLFHRSIFENIGYGNERASAADVEHAARLARADEFIRNLPHGYETLVGERGIKLSGGQRQRIAIARAILKNAPILVLDEATSSLDSESEKYIQEGLKELMKDKTALVIAHRLSTIKHLDRIVVLAEGKIIEDGTHDELIKKKGLYASLWSHQSGEFLGA